MRIRTIKQAHEEILAIDPGSCLTYAAMRKKVFSGDWPSTKVGRRYLVDLDWIIDHLYEFNKVEM